MTCTYYMPMSEVLAVRDILIAMWETLTELISERICFDKMINT